MNIIYNIKVLIYRLLVQPRTKRKQKQKLINDTIGYDFQRLMSYCFTYNHGTDNLLADLRMKTHFIEKGLTMPETHPCFGIMRLRQIANLVTELGSEYANKHEMQYVSKLMNEYITFHKKANIELPKEHMECIKKIQDIIGKTTDTFTVQQRHYQHDEYFNIANGSFTQIAHSRHSGRNYLSTPISKSILLEVAEIANTAPSACNRQPCRMIVIDNKNLMKEIFALNVGCRGFGHLAPCLILVTSDLACRDNITERHQVGVDAGFFGMNLLYALHERQIGACILNWDNLKEPDNKLRSLVPAIKPSETVLYFITCGYMPASFKIPLGLKKPIDETIYFA